MIRSREALRCGVLKILPLKDVTIPTNSFPEVRPNLAGKVSTGIAFIKDSFKTLLQGMIDEGMSQNEWERMTTETLTQFCKRKDVVWLEMLHQIGHS